MIKGPTLIIGVKKVLHNPPPYYSSYHLQITGKEAVCDTQIKHILERSMPKNRKDLRDKLLDAS